ncbi:twin-arginine translocase subunit TatC [Halalkalibacter akibai]|uniref:Sec-independent protein translocase protein TatC n=1 Tax=Halalkalibacter akibai (strain ATCC 43226 / DSM 21942 / CIP 109018 / JCM 9157 / 1139) TaxID=1236973 RepID=W4QZK1_HALA3|nr:twin-arginine translocase subunit TatC [Halalkalibacter akibai]GAE37337.1 twin-arginine translocation protein TatC [Halalkalibacter akibai JCM 9157]
MEQRAFQLVDHLEELRKRLILTITAFFISLIIAFVFVDKIYAFLVRNLPTKLAILGPSDILWVYLKIASIFALAVTIPFAAYQIWAFVRPALNERERKVTLAYIPALFLLFISGISFGYFVLFPIILKFLVSLAGDLFEMFYTTEKYFQFLIQMTLPFGFLFEIPVVIMFLTSLGILNPYVLQKSRKYAYFILIVISILITPPDFLSDVLVIIPLILLYECSVMLSKIVFKRLQAKSLAAEIEVEA